MLCKVIYKLRYYACEERSIDVYPVTFSVSIESVTSSAM